MDSPCLSAGGIRFLNLRVPAGELGLASEDRLAYRVCARTTTGLPRSAPVRHDRGGCCLYSGAVVSALEPVRRSSPLLSRSSPCNHLIGDPTLRSLIGSLLAFTHPIFPLPGSPVWFGSALGFTPLLSHASLPGVCRGQGQDWTLSRAVTTSHAYSIWFRAASRRSYSGVSGLRALGTSACARMSISPQRRTLRHELTAVYPTGARNEHLSCPRISMWPQQIEGKAREMESGGELRANQV